MTGRPSIPTAAVRPERPQHTGFPAFAGNDGWEVARMSGAISWVRCQTDMILPHIAPLTRATSCRFPARCGSPGDSNQTGGHSWVTVNHGGQKYRSDDPIIITQVKIRISLTTVAARFAMIPVSRGSQTGLLEAVISRGRGGGHDRDEGAPRCPLWAMPAAGSLNRVGQHGIDQIYNHQHPQVWIGAAHCQTNHLASTAGHHAETQHYRPAGARTGLAAP